MAELDSLFNDIFERAGTGSIIDNVIAKRNIDGNARAQLNRIDTLKNQILNAGLSPNVTEPRESLFLKSLNIIDKPKQVVLGVADSIFGRRDITDVGILGAASRGLDERINMFDVLRREGLESPAARAILGFTGEILLDPLTLLTGGTKGAITAGGKALTKAGAARKTELLTKFSPGGQFTRHSDALVDDAFGAAGDFQTTFKKFKETKRVGTRRKDIAGKDIADVKDVLATELADIQRRMAPLTELPGFDLTKVDDLFKKKSVRLELNLPFIGALQGKKAQPLQGGAGAIRNALILADNVIRPGKLFATKELEFAKVGEALRDLALTPEIETTLKSVSAAANKGLGALKETLESASKVPWLGAPVRGTAAVTGVVKRGTELGATGFKKIFLQRMVTGKKFDDARRSRISQRAGARQVAQDEVRKLYGDHLETEEGIGLLSEVMKDIDTLAFDSLNKLNEVPEFATAQKEVLEQINKAMRGDEIDVTTLNGLAGLETEFRENLQRYLQLPNRSEEQKDLVLRTINYFDGLAKEEARNGVQSGFLQSYIPHIYENFKKVGNRGIQGDPIPFKERKFNTLSDAFKKKGLVPNLDLATAAANRRRKGLEAVADKKYFQRVVMEHGMPKAQYNKLAKLASAGDGEAIEFLKREKLPLPSFLTDDQLKKGRELVADQDTLTSDILAMKAETIANSEKTAQVINHINADGFASVLQDTTAQNVVRNGMADFHDTVGNISRRGGKTPVDSLHPETLFNEAASVTKDLDGKEFILPTPIANGFDETMQARDFIKTAFGGSELGRAMLDSSDAALDFLKKTVTIPFPAYWVRNLVGDQFFRLADGGLNAISPGVYAETAGLLEKGGKSRSVTLGSGQILDGPTFQKILRENGIQFDNKEFLEIMKDTGKLNIKKLIQKEQGILKTAKSGDIGATFDVASQKLRDKFENFFRANHLLHRLKGGDSVRDAVRLTGDALIDYRDLSGTEQALFRRMFFFYGWMSKATKKTITSLFTSPGDLQVQLKSARGLAEFFADDNAAPSVDEFDRKTLNSLTALEQVAFPIGRDKEGKPITGRGFGLPLNTLLENFSVFAPREMSLSELSEVAQDSTTRTLQKLTAGTNPILKTIAEQLTGRNLFFDKPLDSKFLRRLPSFESAAKKLAGTPFDVIPPEVAEALDAPTRAFLKAVPDGQGNLIADPGRYYLMVNVIPAIARANSTARNLFDEDIPFMQSLLTTFSGVRVEKQDFERSLAFEQEKALRDIIVKRNVKEILAEKQRKRSLLR